MAFLFEKVIKPTRFFIAGYLNDSCMQVQPLWITRHRRKTWRGKSSSDLSCLLLLGLLIPLFHLHGYQFIMHITTTVFEVFMREKQIESNFFWNMYRINNSSPWWWFHFLFFLSMLQWIWDLPVFLLNLYANLVFNYIHNTQKCKNLHFLFSKVSYYHFRFMLFNLFFRIL